MWFAARHAKLKDMTRGNRLANETSPYLLQHAGNPVDWYPWGEEALEKARAEDLPIFLSVGYAACHWCHVMERESFQDDEIAAYLSDHFVPIKVDREERPDIDGIYMDAVQAMTGSGGWPMSVWLTPDGKPFYAGTYFPPAPAHGLPSFRQVLEGLVDAWTTRREEIESHGAHIIETLGTVGRLSGSDGALNEEIERAAFARLRQTFDARWGGFGGAPKFPTPVILAYLLRMAARGTPDAVDMLTVTLDRMADGGIHDQVGGGFARYSTDAVWHVPHFEKMLYDNAQLAQIYTDAWLLTREDRYREVATRTLDYLLREMRHGDGGFFSSQDADSEGVEGKFFTWSWRELRDLIGEDVARAFGAMPDGNWEGTNVLWIPAPLQPGDPREGLEDARGILFDAREQRVRPATDDKILTAWNALAIRALATAGRAFGEPRYVEAAARCAEFVWEQLRDGEGRLLRSWRAGVAGRPGFADDHALLALGLLTLYETTADHPWFERAREVMDALLELFADRDRGGFFQTGSDAETLVVRPKDLYDNAVPSGNSAAAEALLRLSLYTGEVAYEKAGVAAIRLVRDAAVRAPAGFGHTLCALDLHLGPTLEVAVVGELGHEDTQSLLREVFRQRFLPNVVVAVGAPDDPSAGHTVPLLEDRTAVDGKATAFVCERFTCRLPVTDPVALAEQLTI
jgi:uncharacterized protein YyaL (SSP411 family)